jgi:hypothetical protein
MTRDEIVTVLRCCAEGECHGCTMHNDEQRCQERVLDAAADLIENQQRHIEALMKANASLKDTIPRPRTTRSWRKLRHELQVGRSGVEPPRRLRGHGADAGRHQGIA